MRWRWVWIIEVGRTRRNSAEALFGVISVLKPPGNTAWNRQAAWVSKLESWVCRLANIRSSAT